MKIFLFLTTIILLNSSCNDSKVNVSEKSETKTSYSEPPQWSKNVIWYELPVERFRNGDTSNDPTPDDIAGSYPGYIPTNWSITPWTHDWYKPDIYFSELEKNTDYAGNLLTRFVDKVQLRRYGGDLQGVLDKIEYLDSLGITAIYFRPLNDAPSLHKYDARNWRHIDVNFGPDPKKDKETIASEIADDVTTWKLTEADKLFLEVIDRLHQKDIKIILDYSWNHTGQTFWAWQDILDKQEKSKYKDWYWIEEFDNPATPENEFEYHGWVGVSTLPEIKETERQDASKSLKSFEGNLYSQAAKNHIFSVAKRWLDPNGDGDTSDGVDGYRLDVAAETPIGFWRDFRKHVRQINPDAFLLGEIWWEEWPDKLLDPEPFLRGDVFDAVMNYRWYRSVRHFFNKSPDPIKAKELIDSLNRFRSNIKAENNYAMMNYTGGFDTPRILTSLFNKNKYKYLCKVEEDSDYKIHKPDEETYHILKMLLIQQYTYIGAPHIYAGDEMGMWGADDPSSRKPLIWKDYSFKDEVFHPLGEERPIDKVKFDDDLFEFHQKLIRLRKTNPTLVNGDLEFIKVDDNQDLLAYRRFDSNQDMIVLFNHLNESKKISIAKKFDFNYQEILDNRKIYNETDKIFIEVPPMSVYILKPMN